MKYEFGIYQVGYAFFGVGKTLPAAIRNANTWTDEKVRERDLDNRDNILGKMAWVKVTPALADKIRKNGGTVACEHLGRTNSGEPLYGTVEEARKVSS